MYCIFPCVFSFLLSPSSFLSHFVFLQQRISICYDKFKSRVLIHVFSMDTTPLPPLTMLPLNSFCNRFSWWKKKKRNVNPNTCLTDDSASKYIACDPSPHLTLTSLCVVQEWMSVGSTLGQVALGQLAAVTSHCLDNMETRALSLSLLGKYLRLLAVQEDPVYLCALWDRHKQVDNTSTHIYIYTWWSCILVRVLTSAVFKIENYRIWYII